MKTLAGIFILVLLSSTGINAQLINEYWNIDTTSTFNKAHHPFMSALSMWMLRQNYNLNVYQVNVGYDLETEQQTEGLNPNVHYELYLPIWHKNKFSAMLGTSYLKTNILAEHDSLNVSLQDIGMVWLPVQYTTDRWKFTFLYEYFLRGDHQSLYSKTGNSQRMFFMTSYGFNEKWQLTLMAAQMKTEMENEKRSTTVPAFQFRYEPSRRFRMTFGAPVLFGMEWSLSSKFDMTFSQIMFDDTQGFIRYSMHKNIGVFLQYRSTKNLSNEIYGQLNAITFLGQQYEYNNINQQQNAIFLGVGVKTLKNLGVIIKGGYKVGEELSLYNNNDFVVKANGREHFYIGANIQYLKYF